MKTTPSNSVGAPPEAAVTSASATLPGPAEGVEPGGEKKSINQELWQACAGPLASLPAAGTHVVYFPQGHSEQVAASMKKDVDAQIPNYPNLPSKLLCLLHNVTLHADPETDEVYAQMTLQPVPFFDKDAFLRSDLTLKSNKPQTEFFCKTLTASDTSTHGGFSVPRRAAEKIFPPLDFSLQPPAQELVARDLHDTVWTFRHIYRGQPKRHLLTTGWSLFVSGKRLFAGDSVLFIRDEKQQLLLGIRRANRQPANLSSSVLSSDSMHIGILAAAAHAAANNSPFTVFYNPRASPSEFVIPLAKYYKAVCGNQISLGMRFRMMFETEESGTRRYMGTITGISDLDPVRWKNSQWRNLQVGWDESTAGERRNRVSIWEIEPVTAPFFICPPPFFRSKRPRQPGMSDDNSTDFDNIFKKAAMPWLGDDIYMKDPQSLPGLSLVQWMNMQQNPSMANSMQPSCMQSLSGSVLQNLPGADLPHHLGFSAQHLPQPSNLQFNPQQPPQQGQVIDQLPRMPSPMNPLGAIMQSQQHQLGAILQQSTQNLVTPTIQSGQVQTQILQPQNTIQNAGMLQQQSSLQGRQLSRNCQSLPQQQNQQQNIMCQSQQPSVIQTQVPDQVNQHLQMSNNQIQHQLLQKLQQQQQSILAQQSLQPQQFGQLQDPQRQLLEASQSFLRPVSSNQASELPQMRTNPLPQSNITQQMTTNPLPQSNITQQMATNNSQTTTRFSQLSQQLKFQQPCMLPEIPGQMGVLPTSTIDYGTNGAGLLAVAEEIPSCSTSLSANNFVNMSHSVISNRAQQNSTVVEDMTPSASTTLVSTGALETMSCNANRVKDVQQRCDVKPSLNISKNQNQGYFTPQAYLNGAAAQTDYLDTSSSTTSVCVSQNNNSSYNQQSMLLRDTSQDGELPSDPRNNVSYKTNVDGHAGVSMTSDHGLGKGVGGLSKDFSNNLSGSMLANCQNSKDPQNELSSSIVSQSFGVPDMAFNSIDSTMNDGSFMNRGAWPPPVQRMRTYTKVYKRGAVGRSIDITRYSGYDELKQDLARRFGIEGQLEDRQRIGWKLVYVDHENDVLLVGDDPWEEFVNCVRCIKILSPQEVQQMSLDVGNSVLPNQACSSSDNGNT